MLTSIKYVLGVASCAYMELVLTFLCYTKLDSKERPAD